MPVERMLTPRPNDRNKMIMVENAREFIDCVVKFFSDTNQIYKFFLFAYITLMMLFVFVVDSQTYDFKVMGNRVFGGVALVEASLGVACGLAIVGLIKTRSLYLLPLLLVQMSIFLYGFVFYLYPYAELQQSDAITQLAENRLDGLSQLFIVSKSLFMIILRMCPLFVQFLFTAFTAKVFVCLHILEKNDIYSELSLFELQRANSSKISCNSHIWSSMQRKVSSRRREENLDQNQRLPKQELANEMSAKFRKSTFPVPMANNELTLEV